MKLLKMAFLLENRSLHSRRFLFLTHHRRGLCYLPESAFHDDLDNQVLVEGRAWSRTVILNRPSVLNAVNTSMAARLQKLYKNWEDNPDIGFVAMKGSGSRAFCAGGDIVSLYHLLNKVGTYLKPNVAILNGIAMGGGAGISIPATFRIATDKTVFSTLETLIGFHPDAGASFYLSRLPGHLGEYLALTGEKLMGAEMIACGLATHYAPKSRLQLIEEEIGKLVTDDPSVIETSLEKYGELVYPEISSVLRREETVDKCFGHDTVEEIIDDLENEAARTNDVWCISTLKRLKDVSPLSLKVSLRSIREGRLQTFDQCLVREYRMSLQGISKLVSGDFCEGVRSRVVDKDFAPKWDPPTVEGVSKIWWIAIFLP